MNTFYDADDDILTMRVSDKPIAREAAPDWNTCISYAADGSVVEVVILDASQQDDAAFMAAVLGDVARAQPVRTGAGNRPCPRDAVRDHARRGQPHVGNGGQAGARIGFPAVTGTIGWCWSCALMRCCWRHDRHRRLYCRTMGTLLAVVLFR